MVEVNELPSCVAFVNAIGKETGHRYLRIVRAGITLDDVVTSIWDERYTPHIGCEVAPAPDYGFTIEGDLATMRVEEDFASCVAQDGHREQVVGDCWGLVSFSCCLGQFIEEKLERFCCEHACAGGLDDCFVW